MITVKITVKGALGATPYQVRDANGNLKASKTSHKDPQDCDLWLEATVGQQLLVYEELEPFGQGKFRYLAGVVYETDSGVWEPDAAGTPSVEVGRDGGMSA